MSREFSPPRSLPKNLGELSFQQASRRLEYKRAVDSIGPEDLDLAKEALINCYDQIELYKRVIANLTKMGDD